jgi:hypothetical protein
MFAPAMKSPREYWSDILGAGAVVPQCCFGLQHRTCPTKRGKKKGWSFKLDQFMDNEEGSAQPQRWLLLPYDSSRSCKPLGSKAPTMHGDPFLLQSKATSTLEKLCLTDSLEDPPNKKS